MCRRGKVRGSTDGPPRVPARRMGRTEPMPQRRSYGSAQRSSAGQGGTKDKPKGCRGSRRSVPVSGLRLRWRWDPLRVEASYSFLSLWNGVRFHELDRRATERTMWGWTRRPPAKRTYGRHLPQRTSEPSAGPPPPPARLPLRRTVSSGGCSSACTILKRHHPPLVVPVPSVRIAPLFRIIHLPPVSHSQDLSSPAWLSRVEGEMDERPPP